MNSILARIQEITRNEGITIGAMERSIGASKGVLSRAIINRTDIQSKWIQNLVEIYPKYSTRWLLTGHGSMLHCDEVQSTPQTATRSITQQDSSSEATVYYKMYKEKDEKVEELLKEIGCLEERIRQLEAGNLREKTNAKDVSIKKRSSSKTDDAGSATVL